MRTAGIIPARYESVRLPGKPLVDIAGKSLIQRVWESVSSSRSLDRIIIAVDHDEVADHCRSFGAEIVMTPPELPSGTDRIAFACEDLELDYDIIVNIQGDEPLITGAMVDKLVKELKNSFADVATFYTLIKTTEELTDPSVVKVVTNQSGQAIYFSRNPIPFYRDLDMKEWSKNFEYKKHIGIYAYRSNALKNFTRLPQSELEKTEKLEQLRLMEEDYTYHCVETNEKLIGIDTPEDLEAAAKYFSKK